MDVRTSFKADFKGRRSGRRVAEAASGSAANAALSLPAIASDCGIKRDPFEIAESFKKTPDVADLRPGSRDVAKDMPDADGSPLLDSAVTPISAVLTRPGAMRTSGRVLFGLIAGAVLAAGPVFALDGTPAPARPVAAIQQGGVALKNAVPPAPVDNTLTSLQYAAEGGHPVAQWKLGRMYAAGEGVAQDKLRAFEYFSQVANAHADDSPLAPQAPVIANAFVSLGLYYLDGIPDSRVKSDPERAREMFAYAASYFGDATAQYQLARLYLRGIGAPRDPKYAARWLGLAAQKNQHQAQALLGQMLFYGNDIQRQAARGLMLLTLARDSAGTDEAWIKDIYTSAIQKASDDDRAMALQMLQRWLQGRRD